jgi:hypothetical protein
LRWTGARAGRIVIAVGGAMLVAYLTALVLLPKPGGRIVFGDATHHFVQLRSMVFDGDLSFQNDYMRLYGLTHYVPETDWLFTDLTPTGHVRNYMPVGPALLWAPLYLIVAAAQWLLSTVGWAPRPDGFDRALQMVPGVTGVIAATTAAWLSWRLARRWTSPDSAAVGVFATWFGSSALYYSVISPSYSHSASMLATSLFFFHWLDPASRTPAAASKQLVRRAAAGGALAAFASLMRWQDAILLAIPVLEAIRTSSVPWTRRLGAAAAAVLAWIVVFSPQMVVWHVLYGRAFALPQGPSFLRWFAPHPIAVLLSQNHGLFSWTPVIVLSVWGLAVFSGRHPRFGWPIAGFVLAAWYVNASVADWWAGEAFGARRFLSLFPLFVLGLAVWMDSARARMGRLAAVAAMTMVAWLLLFQYELFMKGYSSLAGYPKGGAHFWVERFVVPFRLIVHWLT